MSQPFFTEALARARVRRTTGDVSGALRELRTGLEGAPDYATVVAAARFLENTTQGKAPDGWPVRRVALLGADALEFLQPVLRALAFRDGWWPELYVAPFGVWRQEILDAQSGARMFQPEVTLVWRGWRAAGLTGMHAVDGIAERVTQDEATLARRAAEGLGIVVWPGYDFPGVEVEREIGRELAEHARAVLTEVNKQLPAALPAGVLWADVAEVQAVADTAWEDIRWWHAARQHPAAAGSVALVELWLARLRARWGASRKVLVTDLDNTLWGGIVGEDGVDGVHTGPGSETGAAHTAYQKYLVELKDRGVLLAVCSKNNAADVAEVFARRALPLKAEDFAGWKVNWEDKAENLCALARELNLGLESFVFVDDQPAERGRIREALPEVGVPEMPQDPAKYAPQLKQRRFFETLGLAEEDRGRHAAYQANKQRAEAQAGAATVEDFLRSLEMTGERDAVSDKNLDRVISLLARTNQWNLTTRRHGAAEIAALRARPNALLETFRLVDRFGDNGLVGLWLAVQNSAEEWEIDTWLMSCRVIGRGMEDWMFNVLREMTLARGGKRLRGVYRPTAKNAPVADLLPRLGFVSAAIRPGDDGQVYELALECAAPRPHFIRV
jgi:FkbH-like protein